MRNCINMVLALGILVFTLQYAPASSANTVKLTAAQCAKLNAEFVEYKAFVLKYFGNGPLIQKLIAVAQADLNKVCPVATWDNHFSTSSPFVCAVVDSSGTVAVPIGINSSGGLVNTAANYKTVCASQNACQTIVPQAFALVSLTATTICADPADQTVIHLTDAQIQTAVNAILNP